MNSIKNLTRHASTALLYMLLNTDDHCLCSCAQKQLVENTQITQANAGAALECLLEAKMIEVVAKPRKRGATTKYRVLCVQVSENNIEAAIKERGAAKLEVSDGLVTHIGWATNATQPIYPAGKK